MKIGIIGDVHASNSFSLGKIDFDTQLNSRLIDFINTFDKIIDEFADRKVELVILTGDTFDKKSPQPQEINILSKSFMRAVNKNMKILLLVGNHDQQRVSSTTSVDMFNSLSLEKIKAFPEFSVYTTQDESGQDINIVMCPYTDKNSFGVPMPEQAIAMIKQKVEEISSSLKGKKICVAHYMLGKTVTGQTSEMFSLNELIVPLDVFSGFDLVVAGHVHSHEILQKDPPIIYMGSMDRLSFGEMRHEKKSLVYDTGPGTYEFISNKVRDMFEIDLDYSGKEYKVGINEKIISDIEEYAKTNNLEGAIVKVLIKVGENDSYHINNERLKEFVLAQRVNHLVPIQISTVSTRTLRNKDIDENSDSRAAMEKFIDSLQTETNGIKEKLKKVAREIIESVEGK